MIECLILSSQHQRARAAIPCAPDLLQQEQGGHVGAAHPGTESSVPVPKPQNSDKVMGKDRRERALQGSERCPRMPLILKHRPSTPGQMPRHPPTQRASLGPDSAQHPGSHAPPGELFSLLGSAVPAAETWKGSPPPPPELSCQVSPTAPGPGRPPLPAAERQALPPWGLQAGGCLWCPGPRRPPVGFSPSGRR